MKNDDSFQVYLDQDGVLADFNTSVSDAKKYPHLARLRQEIWKVLPQLEGFEQYEMKVWFQENAKLITSHKDVVQGHRLFKTYTSAFYAQVGKPGFFAGLDLFPGARSLVDGIIEIGQGKLPNVLTAPVQSAHCAPEKQAWIEKNFNGKFANFICQKNKAEHAAFGRVLVDDLTKNTVPWMEQGGGLAVLYKGDVADAHKQVQEFYDKMVLSSLYR